MSKAPVCLVQPVIDKTQPPSVDMPSIPQATDLASAIAAINALSMAMRTVVRRLPPPPIQPQGGTTLTTTKKKPPPLGRWNQVQRITEQVKVTNPNDPTQFVIIDRINNLVMRDSNTGETWVWKR